MNHQINGLFELFASVFVLLHCRKLYLDKSVKGVALTPFVFFTLWGGWNLHYYPSVGDRWSFYCGIAVFSANVVYCAMLVHYLRKGTAVPDDILSMTIQEGMFYRDKGRYDLPWSPVPSHWVGDHLGSYCSKHEFALGQGSGLLPKPLQPRSVLQDWVMELPLREQGTLLTAIRGCDLTPKKPLDSFERQLVAAIRCHVMVAVDPRETDSEPGSFMQSKVPNGKFSVLGHYPQHYVSHLLHAIEILGYRYPRPAIADSWYKLYRNFCHSLHVNPETEEQMTLRLSEDRIAKGEIVS